MAVVLYKWSKKEINFAISKAGEEVYPTESHKNKFR